MKRFILFAIALGILFFLFTTCKKESTAVDTNPKPAEFKLSDFPNTPGWRYTYLVKDSTSQPRTDTVVVDIVGDTLFPGDQPATIWRFHFPGYDQTRFALYSGDTLFSPFQLVLVFPFKLGSQWVRGSDDSVKVVAQAPVQVIAGNFQEGYRLRHTWFLVNDSGLDFYWLVPGVGIVKIDLTSYQYFIRQHWELISYSFPEE